MRRAEVVVFDGLSRDLDPDFVVFYSRPWHGLTPGGEERDGECDFVVVHPVLGFLAIEVKGGGITYDPVSDSWHSRGRGGFRHSIKNPIRQAMSSKHELLRKVGGQRRWPTDIRVRARHGVIFPDAEMPMKAIGADAPRELFCCLEDMGRIGSWVRARMGNGSGDEMGAEGVAAFETLLASPVHLRVPLAKRISDDERDIAAMTPQQFQLLSVLRDVPRLAVGGGAGTGKTIMALETAVRHAEAGLRTCLICVSESLAKHLAAHLAGIQSGARAFSLAQLCIHVGTESGVEVHPRMSIDEQVDLLSKALELNPEHRYDALVIDEAQDIRSHWWIAIEELLADRQDSRVHLFHDTNQSVYGNVVSELASFRTAPIRLDRNLRNTRHIHSCAVRFYEGPELIADGPEGQAVRWVNCDDADRLVAHTVRILAQLTGPEKLDPGDIAVLSVNSGLNEQLRASWQIPFGVTIEHLNEFKGLERPAIVLIATREIADNREAAYIGLSRARSHLTVIGHGALLSWLSGDE